MAEQATCGRGLAEHSSLPAKLAELTASVAEILELHTKALDVRDEAAAQEKATYLKLAGEHRRIAAELKAIGRDMAGSRDLPMGPHDPNATSSMEVLQAFERYVRVERELAALLEKRLQSDQKLLVEMVVNAST